jgi:SAM-dependent methyltransferase
MTQRGMHDVLREKFVQDDVGVWIPKTGIQSFGYTDGRWVERYLEDVFRSATDLSSESEELEHYIKDWNTEYHLTRKRKDLLAGFTHPRASIVLEIGCGCGAMTRILGERYDNVIAAEGSYHRARLARLRTRDLASVEVVCSPYQDLGLGGKFDLVFCIGVLEYAPTYVEADDPFDAALRSMKSMLKSDGGLIIAIENKLGLKYFGNSTEDHSGTFYEGIEGYPRMAHAFETFGRLELNDLLRKYFAETEFYYPFPDYKIPTAIFSDAGLTDVPVGELLGWMDERDYAGRGKTHFDTKLAWPQIVANGLARDMANSFIVVARNGSPDVPTLASPYGVLFNSERRKAFATRTSIIGDRGKIKAQKAFVSGIDPADEHVRGQSGEVDWLDRPTVAQELYRLSFDRKADRTVLAAPVAAWWSSINAAADADGLLDGSMIDAVWHNACRVPGENVVFFDQELVWKSRIEPSYLLLRSAFQWLVRNRTSRMAHFNSGTLKSGIGELAKLVSVTLSDQDFARFVEREGHIQSEVGMADAKKAARTIALDLKMPHREAIGRAFAWTTTQFSRGRNLVRRFTVK